MTTHKALSINFFRKFSQNCTEFSNLRPISTVSFPSKKSNGGAVKSLPPVLSYVNVHWSGSRQGSRVSVMCTRRSCPPTRVFYGDSNRAKAVCDVCSVVLSLRRRAGHVQVIYGTRTKNLWRCSIDGLKRVLNS